MSSKDTQNKRVETISDLSLKLKRQKIKAAHDHKIRVRLTKPFKRPTYFTAHFMFFLVILVSLVFSLTYFSNRGENTELADVEKSMITKQKTYENESNEMDVAHECNSHGDCIVQ